MDLKKENRKKSNFLLYALLVISISLSLINLWKYSKLSFFGGEGKEYEDALNNFRSSIDTHVIREIRELKENVEANRETLEKTMKENNEELMTSVGETLIELVDDLSKVIVNQGIKNDILYLYNELDTADEDRQNLEGMEIEDLSSIRETLRTQKLAKTDPVLLMDRALDSGTASWFKNPLLKNDEEGEQTETI